MNPAAGSDQIWTDSNHVSVDREIRMVMRSYPDVQTCLVDAYPYSTQPGMNWLVTDNHIKNAEYLSLLPEFFGHYHYQASVQHRAPVKLFNCFMNRACPFRQSWLYQLQRHELLDHGFVTYNLGYIDPDLKHLEGKPELFQVLFEKGNQTFAAEHEVLSTKVPYNNLTGSLEQAIIDSKISVVLETYFDRDNIIAFSEKIFRALQLPRPFLLFSAPGALQVLQDIGFDIYHDIVDQGYDQDPNAINRQMSILQQVKHMQKVCYNDSLQQDFRHRAQKNQDLLLKLKSDWPQKFQNIIKRIEQR